MQCTKQHNAHVHPEIEHLEQLRVREDKHENTPELCQSDATQYLHSSHGVYYHCSFSVYQEHPHYSYSARERCGDMVRCGLSMSAQKLVT